MGFVEKCKRGTKCTYINNTLVADCNLKDDVLVADCNPTLYYNNINDLILDSKNVDDNNNINTTSKEVDNKESRSVDNTSLQDTITSLFQHIDKLNKRLYNTPNVESYEYVVEKCYKAFENGIKIKETFSDKQWKLFLSKYNYFEKINNAKQKYFNKDTQHILQPTADNKTTSFNVDKPNNFAPAPSDAEDTHNEMVNDLLSRF